MTWTISPSCRLTGEAPSEDKTDDCAHYKLGTAAAAVFGFFSCYLYAINEYGAAGRLIGWLPALFLAPSHRAGPGCWC